MSTLRAVQIALVLCIAGLAVQLLTSLFWSPISFILFASVGVTLVVCGTLIFIWTVLRELRHTGAL
ncbi:MAG: hypothetical protein JJT93_15955 [Gammaproteobacteria bacterium]|nr:hypothetical protein [Gammaproteobacteria bacterium]